MTCECWWGFDRHVEYVTDIGRCIARWVEVAAAEACCTRGAVEIVCIWSNSVSRRRLNGLDFCEGRLPGCCWKSEGDSASLELLETIYFSWPFDWNGFEDVEIRLVVIEEVEGSITGWYLEVGVKNGWLGTFWPEYCRLAQRPCTHHDNEAYHQFICYELINTCS